MGRLAWRTLCLILIGNGCLITEDAVSNNIFNLLLLGRICYPVQEPRT